MRLNEKNVSVKSKKSKLSITLYAAALVVAIVGIALLVSDIILYKNTVAQYVAQGYAAATVKKQLIPSQLLPGIIEPVGVYGGIAFILFGAGAINQKISKYLASLDKTEVCNTAEANTTEADAAEANISEVNITEANPSVDK